MKAFVIKNQEEKYWSGHEWVEDLIFADMYTNKHEFINDDETWQEITIEETNHQTQKAIECLKEVLEHFTDRPTYFDVARQEYRINDKDKRFIDYINNKIKQLEGEK